MPFSSFRLQCCVVFILRNDVEQYFGAHDVFNVSLIRTFECDIGCNSFCCIFRIGQELPHLPQVSRLWEETYDRRDVAGFRNET